MTKLDLLLLALAFSAYGSAIGNRCGITDLKRGRIGFGWWMDMVSSLASTITGIVFWVWLFLRLVGV
jgi:purine-cytosine permease-like protein